MERAILITTPHTADTMEVRSAIFNGYHLHARALLERAEVLLWLFACGHRNAPLLEFD